MVRVVLDGQVAMFILAATSMIFGTDLVRCAGQMVAGTRENGNTECNMELDKCANMDTIHVEEYSKTIFLSVKTM